MISFHFFSNNNTLLGISLRKGMTVQDTRDTTEPFDPENVKVDFVNILSVGLLFFSVEIIF